MSKPACHGRVPVELVYLFGKEGKAHSLEIEKKKTKKGWRAKR